MSASPRRILLQTTIVGTADDWNVDRFSLLAATLRAAGHQVTARNRADEGIWCIFAWIGKRQRRRFIGHR